MSGEAARVLKSVYPEIAPLLVLSEDGFMHGNCKSILVLLHSHGTEPVRHALCIAEFAPGADFRAARNRIPRHFGPFNR